jgi:thiamine biosynthesis lipoprotein
MQAKLLVKNPGRSRWHKLSKVKDNTKTLAFSSNFRAMNTEVELLVYVHTRPEQVKLAQERFRQVSGQLQLLFAQAEQCLSRFREDSELARLNRQGQLEQASPLLYQTVKAALEMAEFTNGIFDPTILDALEEAGYDRSFELISQSQLGLSHSYKPSFQPQPARARLEAASRAIELPPGRRLDLGGIAKGLTVDRAAAFLRQAGYHNFMISAGGDMFLSGSPGRAAPDWTVDILDPLTLEGHLAALTVRNRAVTTSAITKRRWQIGQQIRHHLIDPRTSQPVDNGLAAVTAVAPTTQLADVLAKTALILGLEKGRAFIEQQKECAGIFITLDRQLIPSSAALAITEYVS